MSKAVLATVACDTGNDTIKVKANKSYYFIPTILKSNPQPRIVFGGVDQGNPADYLDVNVNTGGINGHFHVGELASFGNNQESLGGLKSENNMLIVCMITSIAYALSREYPLETDFLISLGTGLPIEEFFWQNESGNYDFSKVETFKNKLIGKHTVKFNTSLMDNKTITLELHNEDITVTPEGYSALMSILMNENVDSNFVQYTQKNAMSFCLDIGSESCDVSAIMNSKYYPAGMFGFNIGMSNALDLLCKDLRNKTGIRDLTRLEIKKYIFDKELHGIFKIGKVSVNLNQEKVKYYKELANTITHRFKEKLKDNGVDIHRISVLFIVGGGSSEIGDMIIDLLNNDIPEFVKFENHDAIVKNLLGYELSTKGFGKINIC